MPNDRDFTSLNHTLHYALFGALFGCCFPVFSTLIDAYVQGVDISVESAPGAGSVFTLRLPVHHRRDSSLDRTNTIAREQSGRRYTLLAIDDATARGKLVSNCLRQAN